VASISSISPALSSVEVTPTPDTMTITAKQGNYEPKYEDYLLSTSEKLSYKDYQIERHSKPTIIEGKKYDEDGHQYAILKRNDKAVTQFDVIVNPLGTDIRFGLHSLLGQNTKQLIVEQTANRDWQYWIVDLNQKAKIIHDSGKYGVGNGLGVFDIDKDGKEELIQSHLAFWFFNKLNNANSPFPEIVFAYDSKSKEYIPANNYFQDFVLRDIQQHISKVKEAKFKSDVAKNDGDILGAMLDVMLRYIYAGKEKDAWEFYEAEYNLSDKADMKSKIKNKLKEDLVYQNISKWSKKTSK
jgi:hypothetical protein